MTTARSLLALLVATSAACGGTSVVDDASGGGGATLTPTGEASTSSSSSSTGAPSSTGADAPGGGGEGGDGGSGGQGGGGGDGGGGADPGVDPVTCAEAEIIGSYLGCEFWPTITPNLVWSIFDFAVTVTNPGDASVAITVERGGDVIAVASVAPGASEVVYLPWVDPLKGPEADCNGGVVDAVDAAIRAPGGAYRVTTSAPVVVHQFSPFEAEGAGGPPGKDWSACPGLSCAIECRSYTNDASLLLPTSALGTSHRIAGYPSWVIAGVGATLTITGTEPGTAVTVALGALGGVVDPGGALEAGPSGTIELSIDRGEVVTLVATIPGDLSGTLVTSDAPVQVLAGHPCTNVPEQAAACDHLEETVLPSGALGDRYVIAPPTGPTGTGVGSLVRLVGHVDGTTLSYGPGAPGSVPASLDAGEVVDVAMEVGIIDVQGDAPFAAISLLRGGSLGPSPDGLGDPSQTTMIPVSGWRRTYTLPAPASDFLAYLDVVGPADAALTLDGQPVTAPAEVLDVDLRAWRIPLAGGSLAHVLEASVPVSAQVVGYAEYVSYAFPAGVALP